MLHCMDDGRVLIGKRYSGRGRYGMVSGYECVRLYSFIYTVIPRLTSDPANEFFG